MHPEAIWIHAVIVSGSAPPTPPENGGFLTLALRFRPSSTHAGDGLRVGPSLAAQFCGLTCQGLLQLALGRALEDADHLGQRPGPAACELAERFDRGGLIVGGEVPSPPGAGPPMLTALSGSGQPRTLVDRRFEYHTRSLADSRPYGGTAQHLHWAGMLHAHRVSPPGMRP
jgi:hypothetical protein